jgi:hypothetical protein
MYTLHTVNHLTGNEEIREFETYGEAKLQFNIERNALMSLYDSYLDYKNHLTTVFYEFNKSWGIETQYMGIYLEQCEE